VMLDVRNAIADILDHTTLADVAKRVEAAHRAKDAQLTTDDQAAAWDTPLNIAS
jgi:hypothetical protein